MARNGYDAALSCEEQSHGCASARQTERLGPSKRQVPSPITSGFPRWLEMWFRWGGLDGDAAAVGGQDRAGHEAARFKATQEATASAISSAVAPCPAAAPS